MQYTTLGRTGLEVSVVGLGAGGHSRLGRSYGRSTKEAAAVIDAALDLGINFIDTAWAYGTEPLIGETLRGRRAQVVLSSKCHIAENPFEPARFRFLEPQELRARIEQSLANLGTDYIDIYHLHGIEPSHYDECVARAVPVLQRLRDEGKVRFFGITERFAADTGHAMLSRAVDDGIWDVVMVGFNVLNPSARNRVLSVTRRERIGTLAMFAVRRALTSEEALGKILGAAIAAGGIPAGAFADRPLAFLTEQCGAESLAEAAYRFCRHEPGIDVVLTGTGKIEHLRENVASIMKPPLPAECLERLEALFGAVDTLSGD